jgi:DNA (cytosine-5)-methyltransferase 1
MAEDRTHVRKPQLLDLFSGAGGCSVGYHRAGFDVTGWDIEPHPDYPFDLHIGDAIRVLEDKDYLDQFNVVHASPPCPRYSVATPTEARDRHPDLIAPVRDALTAWGGIWVIENVPGAPLRNPVTLCGSSFGLRVRRHRMFESNRFLMGLLCGTHTNTVGVYGQHPDRPGGWLRPDGTSRGIKATSVTDAQDAMGITWMTRWSDLADAVPPAYCEFLGHQLVEHLELERIEHT